MRQGLGISVVVLAALWASSAAADPVVFHPDGCDFEVSFPSAPAASESKTETDRGDSVVTEHAVVNDGANYLRAECTHVPAMHFLDENILGNNMQDMGNSYRLE